MSRPWWFFGFVGRIYVLIFVYQSSLCTLMYVDVDELCLFTLCLGPGVPILSGECRTASTLQRSVHATSTWHFGLTSTWILWKTHFQRTTATSMLASTLLTYSNTRWVCERAWKSQQNVHNLAAACRVPALHAKLDPLQSMDSLLSSGSSLIVKHLHCFHI